MQVNLHGSLCITAVFLYCYGHIEKKTKFSTEAMKIPHFGLEISLWGGGHPLPTPYPPWRLRRLDSARACGARPWPPTSTLGSAYG